MALDRTWFNALVDDDGTNTVGSVWDKADIKNLLDSVDSELARLESAWIGFTPALYSDAGVWSSAGAYVKYRRDLHAMRMQVSIEASALSAATAAIHVQLPVVSTIWAGTPANAIPIFLNGAYEIAAATIPPANNVLTISRVGGQQFPVTTGLYVRGQIIYEI
jgi:hypothetical protein